MPNVALRKAFHWNDGKRSHMEQATPAAGSVSRLQLELEIPGRGSEKCELIRHLAPTTSRALINGLPLQGRVHRFGESFVYFETGLVIGAEKQKTTFKRGDLALLISNGSVCIFLKDGSSQPMNPLGRVTGSLELVESTKPGDVMVLRKSATA